MPKWMRIRIRHCFLGLVTGLLAFASIGAAGCPVSSPTAPPPTLRQTCEQLGSLTCISNSVPPIEPGLGGTCCLVGTNPNASVGYLCAFGVNRQWVGCFATVSQARQICPNAPSIVRCTF